MTDAHGQHQDAVAGAILAIGELQEAISLVTDREESAMAAVIMAVSHNPNVDSAQNATNFIAEVKNRAEEMFTLTEQSKAELTRYAGGF